MQEQHPVPQQISSYQFRLVGDMTLKQFFQLAGGAGIGLAIYALPLPAFIQWPLIIVFALGGAAFAFLPIQDRPLSEWLLAFFRSVYSPTIYNWKREGETVFFKQEEGILATQLPPEQLAAQKAILSERPKESFLDNLETAEKSFLSKMTQMFNTASAGADTDREETPPSIVAYDINPTLSSEQNEEKKEEISEEAHKKNAGIEIPDAQKLKVEHKNGELELENEEVEHETDTTERSVDKTLEENKSNKDEKVADAQFSPDASPPTPPEQPNIIVGQVMDSNNKIVEGAVLEIKDDAGRPARALRTNKAGHFSIVTPLNNGVYKIYTENEGHIFDPVSFTASGAIIAPIAVKAKNSLD